MKSKGKKYYWLKLKDDFFTTREVKKLRRIAGGDTYTIIYLKMQLLSIRKEGLIIYEGTESDLVEQLSLELDEDEDNVKVTLAFLHSNKLIEKLSEDEYLLNKVPESIGSETGAAGRMRRMREKRNNVTPQLQQVTNSYTEIEIEKEIEIDNTSSVKLKNKFHEETIEYKISEYLYERILENDPKTKKPNLYKWAEYIDKLIRIDNREPREIKMVIDFVTNDDFWKTNILSTSKLRKQFQQVYLKAQHRNKKIEKKLTNSEYNQDTDNPFIPKRTGV